MLRWIMYLCHCYPFSYLNIQTAVLLAQYNVMILYVVIADTHALLIIIIFFLVAAKF